MLKVEDYFKIETFDVINPLQEKALFLMYQPLIGNHALTLYLTLKNLNGFSKEETHQYLANITGLLVTEMEEARFKLESYALLKTFHHPTKGYLYILNPPLEPLDFLNHYAFGIQFRQQFGIVYFETLKAHYQKRTINTQGYENITKTFDTSAITSISEEEMKVFLDTMKQEHKTVIPSNFDRRRFFKGMTNIVFPKSLRNDENIAFIAQLMSLYGIDYDEMKVLASRCIDIEKGILDKDALIRRIRNKQLQTPANNGYDLAPVQFLQQLQEGVKVTLADKKLLEEISNDLQLKPEVINVLIEDVFINNNKILAKNYVLKRATTMRLHGIDTVEKALQFIKEHTPQTKSRELKQVKRVKPKTNVTSKTMNDQQRDELLQKLKARFKSE